MCGIRLQFKKGSAAVFKTDQGVTELKLLVQGDPFDGRHHNPILIMSKYMDEITLAEKAFVKDQTDTENVHQIRVKLRQIRSLLSFMKPLLNQGNIVNTRLCFKVSLKGSPGSDSWMFCMKAGLKLLKTAWE